LSSCLLLALVDPASVESFVVIEKKFCCKTRRSKTLRSGLEVRRVETKTQGQQFCS